VEHTQRLIEAYETAARDRDAAGVWGSKLREREEFARSFGSGQGMSLLEVGCGPGHDARFFLDRGLCVTATDLTPAMVQLTREKGVDAEVLDCYDLDQLPGEFDAIYSVNCLVHIPRRDLGHILQMIANRLAPGGLLYLGLWGGDGFEGIWEEDRYEPKRFFSFQSPTTILGHVQRTFALEYYRRIRPSGPATYNSIIARKPA